MMSYIYIALISFFVLALLAVGFIMDKEDLEE